MTSHQNKPSALPAIGEVAVLQLEWERVGGDWYAESAVGQYGVGKIGDTYSVILRRIKDGQEHDETVVRGLSGHIGAKVAAQAHFAAAIRSSLLDHGQHSSQVVSQEGGEGDDSQMKRISALIADLQDVLNKFGDTCVYIRRDGLSWGAVALNRQADDEKNGVFNLQATHDRDMADRLGQIERLIADRNEWRDRALSTPLTETAKVEHVGAEVVAWCLIGANGRMKEATDRASEAEAWRRLGYTVTPLAALSNARADSA